MRNDHDSDAAFERWLLDAARREELPAALTEKAWARFEATSATTANAVSGRAGARRLGLHLSRASVGWLALGLVAGGALTLALVTSHPAPLPGHSTDEQSAMTGAFARPPDLPPSRAVTPEDTTPEDTTPEAPKVPPDRQRPFVGRRPASTLAAEIEALEAVRAAIVAGNSVDALEGVAAFHRRFPRAQLRADAEGFALEALLAQGAGAEAAERARDFIRNYPHDPHVPRFAPLAEQ